MTLPSRYLILGLPGSGKTTLASKLREISLIPTYCLDDMLVKIGTRAPDKQYSNLQELTSRTNWIIDGLVLQPHEPASWFWWDLLEMRLARAQHVIFLDLPIDQCIRRVLARDGVLTTERMNVLASYALLIRPRLVAALEASQATFEVVTCSKQLSELVSRWRIQYRAHRAKK